MSGFLVLLALYAGVWLLFLAPGAYLLLRRDAPVPTVDDGVPDAVDLLRSLVSGLLERVVGTVSPGDVPRRAAPAGRRPRPPEPSADALRVTGPLRLGEGEMVLEGLIVEGDLVLGAGSRLAAPAWVRGDAVLEAGSVAAALAVEGTLRLGESARVTGRVVAAGDVRLEASARIDGDCASRRAVVLAEGSYVGSALAPVVRGAPVPGALEVAPPPSVRPLGAVRWDDELDAALVDLWPEGRLNELVEAFRERTGTDVRGVHLLRRARELGLFASGVPRRPAFLGRRPAWVLTPEIVRVGADLRIPRDEVVGYSLVVEGALEVFQNAELQAPVRSGRGLLLHTGAVVHGQVVSDGLIVCEEGSAVLGPADSSMHILLFANARVGLPGFGGAHAKGAIGLEPGAEILGGAVAGLGVRGEPLRPEPMRIEAAEVEQPVEKPRRRRRRRRKRREPAREAQAVEVVEDDRPWAGQEVPPDASAPSRKRRRRRRRKRRVSGEAGPSDADSADG